MAADYDEWEEIQALDDMNPAKGLVIAAVMFISIAAIGVWYFFH
jgi:hypothetical protein